MALQPMDETPRDPGPNESARAYLANLAPRDSSGRFRQLEPGETKRAPYAPQLDAIKRAYLAQLEDGASVREACNAVGIRPWQPYAWAEHDQEFAQALALVDRGTVADLASNLRRLGRGDGMPAVVATLAELKARDPEHWVEKRQEQVDVHHHLHADGVIAALLQRQAAGELPGAVVEGEHRVMDGERDGEAN